MKALLLKDVYTLWRHCRIILFLDVIIIVASFRAFSSNSPLFVPLIFPALSSVTIPMSVLSWDEFERWNIFADTTPMTRRKYVSSKYFLELSLNLIFAVIVGMCVAIVHAISGIFSAKDLFSLLSFLFCFSSVTTALIYPFLFKFGMEKGRMVMFALAGAIGVISLSTLSLDSLKIFQKFSSVMLLVGSVCLFALSWVISVRIYERREL